MKLSYTYLTYDLLALLILIVPLLSKNNIPFEVQKSFVYINHKFL